MKQHDDTWKAFALTGDPRAYLKYKERKQREKEYPNEAN